MTAAVAENRVSTPDAYRRAVHDVSEVVAYGLWFDKCLGDPENAEYKPMLLETFGYLQEVTDRDSPRAHRLLDDAVKDAQGYFRNVNCNKDRYVLKNNADVAVGDLRRMSAGY
jgi:hypothetical protein